MTIDRPNVLRIGTSTPARALRSSTARCSAQPIAAIAGTTIDKPEERRDAELVGEHEQREGGDDRRGCHARC